MRKHNRFLLAYGSLMEGVTSPEPPHAVRSKLHKIATVTVSGHLYRVVNSDPTYPGFIPDNQGLKIEADLFFVTTQEAFDIIDSWEGVTGKDSDPYRKQIVSVYHKGATYAAWTYVGNHPHHLRESIEATSWRDWWNQNNPASKKSTLV